MYLLSKGTIAEAIALGFSLFFFTYLKNSKLKLLPYYLVFILSVELFARYYVNEIDRDNTFIYNYTIPIEYSFYLFLTLSHIDSISRIQVVSTIFIFLAFAIAGLMIGPPSEFERGTLIIGQLLVIFFCCVYFFESFKRVEKKHLYSDYFSWLATGLLLFNLVDFVYFIFLPILEKYKLDKFDEIFSLTTKNMVVLLNLMYIFSIVHISKQKRSDG